eukprot:8429593-Pyramimonas_sp.AAC.1
MGPSRLALTRASRLREQIITSGRALAILEGSPQGWKLGMETGDGNWGWTLGMDIGMNTGDGH